MALKKYDDCKFSDENLHIEYQQWVGTGYRNCYLTLYPTTSISIFGENPSFEWEGNSNKGKVKVSLLRQNCESEVVKSENFPDEYNQNGISTNTQLKEELRRVLRQLD